MLTRCVRHWFLLSLQGVGWPHETHQRSIPLVLIVSWALLSLGHRATGLHAILQQPQADCALLFINEALTYIRCGYGDLGLVCHILSRITTACVAHVLHLRQAVISQFSEHRRPKLRALGMELSWGRGNNHA